MMGFLVRAASATTEWRVLRVVDRIPPVQMHRQCERATSQWSERTNLAAPIAAHEDATYAGAKGDIEAFTLRLSARWRFH